MEFKELEKQDKHILDTFFQNDYHENAHLNFTNLYLWRKPYHIRWAIDHEVLYMVCKYNGKLMALQPLGPINKTKKAISTIIDYFDQSGFPLYFSGLEESFAKQLERYHNADFVLGSDRDDADYVYAMEDLLTLAGRKFQSKRNHINSFKQTYPQAQYLPITDEIIPQCRDFLESWYKIYNQKNPGDPFIKVEKAVLFEILDDFQYFKLKGGVLMIDNEVVALSIGEQLNDDTAVIHIEKAHASIRGAYPMINQQFVENEWQSMTYINREEDMGLEGLRKAKESYQPVKMISKYHATLA